MEIDLNQLPQGGLAIIQRLNCAGYEAWFVGGCVRDLLMGRVPHDWDICTNALPEETEHVFEHYAIHETGIAHGTVLLMVGEEGYEVTTYRTEGTYSDHRHPDKVCFVRDIASDLARRDFTINAMAYHPEHGVIDFYNGRKDLIEKKLRTVGSPQLRFQEDALRILRALRFAARLQFEIDPLTAEAIHCKRNDLALVANERIFQELKGILQAPGAEKVLLAFSDVLAVILPEIALLIGYDQNTPHHHLDAWQHTVKVLAGVSQQDMSLRLAALLHDTGKPECQSLDVNGRSHFYGHNQRSAELAHQALMRLHCDTATRFQVEQLVALHDLVLPISLPKVRHFLAEVGEETVQKLLLLKRADVLAQSEFQRDEKLQKIDAFEIMLEQIKQDGSCWTVRQLAIRGADFITLGVEPGPQIGQLLVQGLTGVMEGKVKNEREALLQFLGF